MLDTLENLSFASGAVVIALVSAVGALCALLATRWVARWALLLSVSVAVSYSLYWLPVWRGANSAEYSTWEGIIVVWAAVGAVTGSFVFAASWWMRRSGKALPPN
jgi:hypothetical protein